MGLTLFSAKEVLQMVYLDIISEALAGKELETAEEYAERVLEKLDSSR